MKKKRGVAPVIATVLLIALTIVLAAIIFLWVRGFLIEQVEKGNQPAEEACRLLSFDATLTPDSGGLYSLDMTNSGNIAINEVDFKRIEGGASSLERIPVGLSPGDSNSISVGDLTGVDRVVVIPVLLGTVKGTSKRKVFPCVENLGKIIDIPQPGY